MDNNFKLTTNSSPVIQCIWKERKLKPSKTMNYSLFVDILHLRQPCEPGKQCDLKHGYREVRFFEVSKT